jgi:hypothetical protein
MQSLHFGYRLLLVVWTISVAFGIGVEAPRAAALDASCLRSCNQGCRSRGGCDTWVEIGCDCYYYCMNGESGSVNCTE